MPRVSEMIPHGITPTTGFWEELDSETQNWLSDIAANVKLLLWRGKADDAQDELESYGLTVELYIAIWTRFESGERRVLKAVMTARKENSK